MKCWHDSKHAHWREVDGKAEIVAFICLSCRCEWWANKEFKERFGKQNDPYEENGKIILGAEQ